MWLTETAEAACGGNPWASTFLDTFRYLDQLGRLAKAGVQMVAHNTLAASDYGLLDEKTLRPRPNYWAALLWRRLMGTIVLDAVVHHGTHLYAHCRRGMRGAVTLLAINTDRTNAATLRLPVTRCPASRDRACCVSPPRPVRSYGRGGLGAVLADGDDGACAVAEQGAAHKGGHGGVGGRKRQRAQFDGHEGGDVVGCATEIVVDPSDPRCPGHAAQAEDRHATHVGAQAQPTGDPGIQRRRRDAGHGRRKIRSTSCGQTCLVEGTGYRRAPQFDRVLDEEVVGSPKSVSDAIVVRGRTK